MEIPRIIILVINLFGILFWKTIAKKITFYSVLWNLYLYDIFPINIKPEKPFIKETDISHTCLKIREFYALKGKRVWDISDEIEISIDMENFSKLA